MPLDPYTTQTYHEAYVNPKYDLAVMRIPTKQEVKNAIQVFLNQIDAKKSNFNDKLGTVQNFFNEPKINIDKLDMFIESINDLVIAGNSLLVLINSYLDYYNRYGRYSTQVSVYHLEIPKIKFEISNALTELEKIKKKLIKTYANKHASRVELDVDNAIDWDESPTIYQATTIAHGHILCFRMRWKADGYSLGEVKYSKSLGPCEKEQVAILDWSRSESSSRLESTISRENFSASFSRDRDVNEIINTSLSESIKGKSIGVTTGAGTGGGASGAGQYGGFMLGGVASGFSSIGISGSVASQNATRSLSSSTMNKLRDRINQSSQAVRSQRSIVIQSVSQNERVSATTKVITNKNLCHSVNYLFFEILKHYAVEQEIVDVKECLFIPMKITPFDAKKAIRWRHVLEQIVPSKDLFLGFDALQNIENNTPSKNGVLADETIQDFFGQIKISFDIPLPNFNDPSDDDIDSWNDTINNEWQQSSWSNWYPFIQRRFSYGPHRDFYRYEFWKRSEAQKIKNWEDKFVPVIVKDFIEDLQFTAVNGNIRTNLKLDVTQITKYHKSGAIEVSLNISDDTPNIRRSDIKKIVISSEYSVPNNANIIVKSGALSYRSQSLNEFIFLNNSIKNDMSNNDTVSLITPLNNRELVNPAIREIERANLLLTFLNDHLSEMHQFIFAGMDRNTRFMMLDGVKLNAAGGRSVSSLVENEIIDIVGNSIVMPVASGLRIDPVFRSQDNLLDIYKPKDKVEPFRISLPTGGYFMEAVQGSCNSCEELDYTKARFHGFGCTDEPTAIQELSTDTRRTDPGDLQAKELPTNIVNFQNVPQAPNPTDLSSVLSLLGKGDSFRDLSGLTENQKNALAALVKNADSAVAMGQMASDLVKAQMGQQMEKTIDSDLGRINREKEKGNLSEDDAKQLTKDALDNKNKVNTPSSNRNENSDSTIPEAIKSGTDALNNGANKVSVKENRNDGSSTEIDLEKDENFFPNNDIKLNRNFSTLHNINYGKIPFGSNHHHIIRKSIFNVSTEYVQNFHSNIVLGNLNSEQTTYLSGLSAIIDIDGSPINITDAKKIHYYTSIHRHSMGIHNSKFFLSWHRKFIHEFETDLGMPLPYWDWYENNEVPSELESNNLLTINNAYFANLNRIDNQPIVKNNKGAIESFWNTLIANIENESTFDWRDDFEAIWEGKNAIRGFRFHDEIHVQLGGKMGDIKTAPFDPIFWLHHCFVDKIWTDLNNVISRIGNPSEFDKLYLASPMNSSLPAPYSDIKFEEINEIDNSVLMPKYSYEGLFRVE